MVLNEDLDYDQVAHPFRGLHKLSSMAKAFHGKPEKQKLRLGERLYRATTLLDGFPFRGIWWMSERTYEDFLRLAGGDRKEFLKITRSHLAVKMDWSPGMRFILQVRLTQPVWAWVGPARAQKETFARMKSVTWPGGAEQIFLPNLSASDYRFASDYASVEKTYTVPVDYDPQEDPECV